MASDEQKETPKPPDGYADWIECVFADTEMRSHWLFGDPEKGRFYERQDAVKLARAELAALRNQLSQANKYAVESNNILRAAGWWQGHIEEAHALIADFEQSAKMVQELREQVRQARNAALDEAAMLHEQIPNHCSHEINCPGCGAIGAIVRYRDAIRALKGS